ncbi:peptidase inhibitor family I36 protein [Actinoplanes sp. Pm04-4]|uniref:Peptidase inhibitor family I36 protein n=1 Tax=Paractinoplanes pyxinae TaxID=2997416 RepID=A0ABT4AXU7_9ACTN|nr:peptidase inhibitor family I36 protein [Actinoplanes pyxinae]MCY1139071.1 peptidase inhibitor family I36 protein [Actinoplanes pyxinae]
MPHRFRQIFSALAVVALVLLGTVSGANPAQAATACPNNFFCLYHWVDQGGGRWQIENDGILEDKCVNLNGSRYTDGDVVAGTSASLINNTNSDDSINNIVLYSNSNCTGSNTEQWNETELDSGHYRALNLNDIGWYHEVRSMKFKTGLTGSLDAGTAQAAVDLDCLSGILCLYDWVGWEHGKWQTNVNNWPTGTCWNLSGSTFNNGTTVNNSATSFADNAAGTGKRLTVYDWENCDDGAGKFTINLGLHQQVPNMGIWFERVSSIRIQ